MHRGQNWSEGQNIFFYFLIYFYIRSTDLLYFSFPSACCTGYWLVIV